MYSVMIVDDEPIIRMGLKKIVRWEDYGFKVICEARDGEEALKLLKEHSIDFIVSDIKMHKLNGIDLLREIRKLELDTLVVLLSGYDEFSYAQECIRLGAFDYILKPIDSEKLKNILTNVYKKLKRKEEKEQEYNINRSITREKILHDLLQGKNLIMIDEYILQYDLPLIKGKVQVAIVEINDIVVGKGDFRENTEWGGLEKKLGDLMEEELGKSGLEHFYILDEELGKKVIIVQTEKEIELQAFNDDFVKALKVIFKRGNEELQTNLNIGIGNSYNQVYSIYKSYLNSKEALKYKYVMGTNKIIHINDLSHTSQQNFVYPIEKEKALISSIVSGKEDALNMLQQLIKEISEMLNFDIFKINIALTQMAYNIYNSVLKKYSFLEDIYNLSQVVKISSLGIETLVDIEKQFTDNIRKLISTINEYNLNQSDNIVQRACEYVLNNIDKDITLTSMANYLNISKNYLCSIFKQQTGENFLEYMTKAKMERAKVLLKRNDYKVYEVSEVLGYKETAYFSKLFKKHTGYNPAEYKKCNI